MSARRHPQARALLARLLLLAGLCVALTGCELTMSPAQRLARAEKAIAAGDLGAAMIDLRKVLQTNDADMRARLLLARAEFGLGDARAAATDLERIRPGTVRAEELEPLRWRIRLAQQQYREVAAALVAPLAGLADGERQTLRGYALLELGEFAAARAALEAAASLDPHDGEARAALGIAIARGGDAQAALAELEAAALAVPSSASVQRALGELHLRAGRLAEAEAAYRRALGLAGPRSNVVAYVAAAGGLGDALLGQGKVEAATQLANELAKTAPSARVTILLRGRVAAASHDYPTALENLQRILNAEPDNVPVRTMLGSIALEQGNLEQATVHLQRAAALNPGYVPALRLLGQALLAQGRPDEAARTLEEIGARGGGSAELLLLEGKMALAAGKTDDAMAVFDRLERQELPAESVRLDLAAAFIRAGRPDRALRVLGAPQPGGSDRAEQLRLVALAAQQPGAAIQELQAYAERRKDDVRSVSFAALALATVGEAGTARSLLAAASAAHPKDASLLVSLARVQVRAGDLDAATAALERAVALEPATDTYAALAQIAGLRGRDDEATRWLESARRRDPKGMGVRLALAEKYLARQQIDAASDVMKELLALAPGRLEVQLLAAAIAAERKDATGALQHADEAVRIAPREPRAWLGKGEIHGRLGQREQARTAFGRAEALAPGSIVPFAAFARLDLRAGNVDGALETARRAQQRRETLAAGLKLEGGLLMKAQRAREAHAVFERLQLLAPSGDGAVLLSEARRSVGAASPEKPLEDWLAGHPQDVLVRKVRAAHAQSDGEAERAIQLYEGLLQTNPDDALVLNNLAWLYVERHDGRGLELARRAYRLAPGNAAVADTLGVALTDAGQWDEGLGLLRHAALAAPTVFDIQYHLADALARKGDRAAAGEVVARLLKQDGLSASERTRAEALKHRVP